MNAIGIVAAATAFLSIWVGHVSVRRVEASSASLAIPTMGLVGSGLGAEWISTRTSNPAISVAIGILGITLIWDAVELWRQQSRVRRGHAPANPANPRHARMLAEAGSRATTRDLLKREPRGYPGALDTTSGAASHRTSA
jgi:hypothetical protein